MDAHTHDLIINMATRAGMIMEDARAEAISVRAIPPDDLARHLDRLREAAENSAQFLRSALILADR